MRMAKTPEKVKSFEDELAQKLKPLKDREMKLFLKYKNEEVGVSNTCPRVCICVRRFVFGLARRQVGREDQHVGHALLHDARRGARVCGRPEHAEGVLPHGRRHGRLAQHLPGRHERTAP